MAITLTFNKYFDLKKTRGRWGAPELELLASNFPMYVQQIR